MSENVNHPKHYNQGRIEVIEFIEDKQLGFHRGNAVKYIARAGLKDPAKEIEDLRKAIWYLSREIELIASRVDGRNPARPNDMNARAPEPMSYETEVEVRRRAKLLEEEVERLKAKEPHAVQK